MLISIRKGTTEHRTGCQAQNGLLPPSFADIVGNDLPP